MFVQASLAIALRYGPLFTVGAACLGAALTMCAATLVSPRRSPLRPRALVAFGAFWGVIIASVALAERERRVLGAPRPRLVAIDAEVMRWTSRWTDRDLEAMRRIALSPIRWRALAETFASLDRYETPWPPLTPRDFERAKGLLRLAGDCQHEAELYLRTGRLTEALGPSPPCPSGALAVIEARWSIAPIAHCEWSRGADAGCARSVPEGVTGLWRSNDPGLVRLSAWWSPSAARGEAVSLSDGPLRCVSVAAARIVADEPELSWADFLSHPHPACRIIGATRAQQRNEAALAALREASGRASRGFRPLLDLARTAVTLEGMSLGRISPVGCAAQRTVGVVDPEYLRAHPELAGVLLHAARATRCEWVHDQIFYPAREAQSWLEVLAGDGRSLGPSLSARRERALQWEGLHRDDRRFGPRARALFVAQEPRIEAMVPALALGSLDRDFVRDGRWPGGFTWAAVIDAAVRSAPRESARCERGPRPGPRVQETAPVFDPCTLRLDYRAAASMQRAALDASLVEFWRTGQWSPSRDAPEVYRSPLMNEVVAASASGRGAAVLAALGAPTARSLSMLAAVAYRLSSERDSLEGFVRASTESSPSLRAPMVERFWLIDTAVRAAQRLRLAALAAELGVMREGLLTALRGPLDPWLNAVIEALLSERGRR